MPDGSDEFGSGEGGSRQNRSLEEGLSLVLSGLSRGHQRGLFMGMRLRSHSCCEASRKTKNC